MWASPPFLRRSREVLMVRALPLLILIAWAPAAHGEWDHVFILRFCVQEATDIVVVTGGEKFDGQVEVVESWTGDLRKGNRLDLPDLADFAKPKARAIVDTEDKPEPGSPTHVTGSRMVLFLKREAKGREKRVAAEPYGGMKVSVVWVEAGKTYAHSQRLYWGPSGIMPLGVTEPELRRRVKDLIRLRAELDRVLAIIDPGKRAEALGVLGSSGLYQAPEEAVKGLSRCGKPAIPALRRLLEDDRLSTGHHAAVVWTLGKVGGAEVEPELRGEIIRELAFWKDRGPKLPVGWWEREGSPLAAEERQLLFAHVRCVQGALQGLQGSRSADSRKVVLAFRDFWLSLPQLAGLEGISKECDSVLAGSKK